MDSRKERARARGGIGPLLRRTGAAALAPFEALVEQHYAAPWADRERRVRR